MNRAASSRTRPSRVFQLHPRDLTAQKCAPLVEDTAGLKFVKIGAPGFEPGTSCSRGTGQGVQPPTIYRDSLQ